MYLKNLSDDQLLMVARRMTEDINQMDFKKDPQVWAKIGQLQNVLKNIKYEMDSRTKPISAEERSRILDDIVSELP